MKLFILRTFLLLLIWAPTAYWSFDYAQEEISGKRFEHLVLSNGRVSSVQREYLFRRDTSIASGDYILEIEGQSFDQSAISEYLDSAPSHRQASARVLRDAEERMAEVTVRPYSKRDVLVFLILPGLLSVIFLGFAILTPFQKFSYRKSQEAVEVFSLLCFWISVYFVSFFPSVTLGTTYPFSVSTPIFAMMLVHLFTVYPKKKLKKLTRLVFLSGGYLVAVGICAFRVLQWHQLAHFEIQIIDFSVFGSALLIAMGSLGNTLFTSQDFWARRRARLLSLLFLICFVAVFSVFVSFIWYGPRISWERILAFSLIFPSAFAVIFSKESVFDLERFFKKGVHQFLFLGIATSLAVAVGVGWSQLGEQSLQFNWILWAAIGISVALFSKPVGLWAEKRLYQIVQAKVRFPQVGEIFEKSKRIDQGLSAFGKYCERYLGMRELVFRFFRDPTQPWNEKNQQVWKFTGGRLIRVFNDRSNSSFTDELWRGEIKIGELAYSGGDSIAFDPLSSKEWERVCSSLSRGIELLVLREYLEDQQGLLAVGRMQALLAHEMKNPLAVIKVCTGLLQTHLDQSEESEEITRTINQEVERITEAVQKVFNHSGKHEKKGKVNLFELVQGIRDEALSRFTDRRFEVVFFDGGSQQAWNEDSLWMWTERIGLRQSILNLVVNAFEAGSQLVRLELHLDRTSTLKIVVGDQGPGIPKGLELFRPFVSTKANGTGLGLSSVKAFVDRQSGRLEVDSKMGRGTRFTMEFSPHFVVNR